MKKKWVLFLVIAGVMLAAGVYLLYRAYYSADSRTRVVFEFLRRSGSHDDLVSDTLSRCGDAPFVMPTRGMIGFLWDDSFRPGHHHQGIDIFAGTRAGETPVYAAHDGYLTRLPDWKATVIIRIPSDPLAPGRQIWTYYTHLADERGNSFISDEYPPGTKEVFVSAGTLLGYQGNYSGSPGNPTGVHLHFSIVKDDGEGMFLNELDIRNTIDPSPYFGLALNGKQNRDQIPICAER